MASLISSTVWVKRGQPAQHPKRYNLDKNELERVSRLAGDRLAQVKELLDEQVEAEEEELVDVEEMIAGEEEDEEEEDNDQKKQENSDNEWSDQDSSSEPDKMDLDDPSKPTDEMAQYNLDDYDKEESKGVSMGAFSNIKGLQFYQNQTDDPYVTLDDLANDETHEREELEIYPTDNLIIAARTEDDVSQLDIYVYDQGEENLYVHHDLLLPAMPLCLEWIDFSPAGIDCDDPTRKGSFIAVGTMDPEIEIWNLDVVDGLYPDAILGNNNNPSSQVDQPSAEQLSDSNIQSKKNKKKKKKNNNPQPSTLNLSPATHHTSSVLSLSHNKLARNLLLSASADTTIKLWDLNQAPSGPSSTFSAIESFQMHTDKVQSAQWNPKEATVVLSGGWDGMLKVWDTRNSGEGVEVKVDSDVECLRWDPFNPQAFIVTLDNGLIQSFDSRMLSQFSTTPAKKTAKPLWTLSAHDSSVSAFDISPVIPGLLVSGGVDKMVKVWNLEDKSGSPKLSMVVSRDLGVGKVFSVGFCPDDPTTIAVAGSKASLQIWDLATNNGVRSVFRDRLKQFSSSLDFENRKPIGKDGVLSVVDDLESDDDDN
ncbi:hypothetical protein PGT21_011029 [Puccinia graminis f. sp. tritici]|uniref:Uncharacterized protein n=1 Tax=Puccinia graminis f. sp. tritici TaxID=56615 RepID=A0A5B0LS93_PUCGR|nr:hypothetical protein PGTUg99_022010 [Puccinia graminis f. sp. tritici]KAA1083906.1 hypothetical protein PGT21_011029 [Puccinia graminis f. sp. tritici]